MPTDDPAQSTMYALLIGIDCYLPHTLKGGGSYPSLRGCVADIDRVEGFLRSRLEIPEGRTIKLTATNTGAAEPPEPRKRWPTYRNMVAAFERMIGVGRPGDQIYIHYSGHGGRQKTAYPDLKGPAAQDEGLVPMDIGESRYLLDLELAYLLRRMVDGGLLVTLVLDCCHSGGATRGLDQATPRGIDRVDEPHTEPSLVAPAEALAGAWQAATRGQTRALKPGSGWLPEPEGYVLLAACRPHESAWEYQVEPGVRSGALTYWLLDAFKQIGPDTTYQTVHARALAKVHTIFPVQSPQLQGEGSRVVFGSQTLPPPQAVLVMQVDPTGDRIRIATGLAQTVRTGAQFAVYPAGTAGLVQTDQRLALVTVDQVGADSSWATISQRFSAAPIEPGAQAVLVEPGTVRLSRAVGFVVRDDLPPGIDQAAALDKVRTLLPEQGRGWLAEPAGQGKAVDYQVAITEQGTYEIWDPAGQAIPHLRPPLHITDPAAAGAVVGRLVHLTKYHNILLLDNLDAASPLANGLSAQLMRPQPGYEPGDPLELSPLEAPGGTPVLADGQVIYLSVCNRSRQVLNVTVLALQADWSVAQVYPRSQDYETLDPGAEIEVGLVAQLPAGHEVSTDVLKVFATLGPTSYHWLELPVLDNPPVPRGVRGTPGGPLETLLQALTAERPTSRTVSALVSPSHEWTMAQVEVRVAKGAGG